MTSGSFVTRASRVGASALIPAPAPAPLPVRRSPPAALGLYRLLNVGQMVRVGVGKDRATVSENVRVLVGWGLVRGTDPRPIAGCDKLPALYWLYGERAVAPAGAEVDVLTEQPVAVPSGFLPPPAHAG